jgi:hypothetical protein
MIILQILCRCNKVITTIEEASAFEIERYKKLADKGYIVLESDFVQPSERAKEPCPGRPSCPLRADWTTQFGFNDLLKEPKNCLTV